MSPMSLLSLCDDVLKYELFPYLTYQECMDVNLVLPKDYMVIRKISSEKILSFELHLIYVSIYKELKGIFALTGQQKETAILRWLSDYKNYAKVFQYNSKARDNFLARIDFFADSTKEETIKTPEFLFAMDSLRKEIGELEKFPFIKEKSIGGSGYLSSF
jgi:hypothetical protein